LTILSQDDMSSLSLSSIPPSQPSPL